MKLTITLMDSRSVPKEATTGYSYKPVEYVREEYQRASAYVEGNGATLAAFLRSLADDVDPLMPHPSMGAVDFAEVSR